MLSKRIGFGIIIGSAILFWASLINVMSELTKLWIIGRDMGITDVSSYMGTSWDIAIAFFIVSGLFLGFSFFIVSKWGDKNDLPQL